MLLRSIRLRRPINASVAGILVTREGTTRIPVVSRIAANASPSGFPLPRPELGSRRAILAMLKIARRTPITACGL